MFVLGNIQSIGIEIQSKRIRTLIIRIAQELRTTFGKMPNKFVVTLGQVVTSCNGFIAASKCRVAVKIYPTSVLYPQFFFFSYVMNTNLCQYPFFISLFSLFVYRFFYETNWFHSNT